MALLSAPGLRQMLSSHSSRHKPRARLAYLDRESCFVNLAGDYSYLSSGYYASQDLETAEKTVHPTCKEVLDSYIVPLFLEKARLAGLPIPSYYITNDYFEPPVVVDSVNPFMSRHSVVLKPAHQERVAKSLTRNYTYAICCQILPPGARVGQFRAVLGWTLMPRYRPLAAAIWQVFHMPLAQVRVTILASGEVLPSALRPLPLETLGPRELGYLDQVVTWPT